jgi:hypothetical protein
MSAQATLDHLAKNWKTTLAGFLNTIVALSAAGAFAPNPIINTKVSGYLCGIAATSNLVLHVIMKDGTQTTVNLPPNSAPAQINIPAGSQVKQETTIATPK